jgi:hypothetical protein
MNKNQIKLHKEILDIASMIAEEVIAEIIINKKDQIYCTLDSSIDDFKSFINLAIKNFNARTFSIGE